MENNAFVLHTSKQSRIKKKYNNQNQKTPTVIEMVISQSDLERVAVQWSKQRPKRAEASPLSQITLKL